MPFSLRLTLNAGLVLLALASPAVARADSADSPAWSYADDVVERMERHWSDQRQGYGGSPFHLTVGMLTIFANAKMAGYQGPSRKDERIEPLARRLITRPAYITTKEDLRQANSTNPHIPGFTTGFGDRPGYQHVAISNQASEALGLAAKSGALSEALAKEVGYKVYRVAAGRQFSYPKVEANQINWPLGVWLAAARTSGNWSRAKQEAYRYMRLWVSTMHRPIPGYLAPNMSRGLGVNYFPESPLYSPVNQTSTTEYALIIYSGFDLYQEMIAHGMKRLPGGQEAKMRRWANRLVSGEWTHGGWPNWDTGLGYERWQLINYFAWTSDALTTLATSRYLASDRERRRAAFLFYRSLDRFRWLRDQGMRGSTRYGVKSPFTREGDMMIADIRLGASASRAALSQIDNPSQEPGGWSWWDRDRSRLAVSNPRYSSVVITPYNRIGYGGLEPARLLDSQGRPLTTLGSTAIQSSMHSFRGARLSGSTARLSPASIRRWRVSGVGSGSPTLSGQSGAISVGNRFNSQGVNVDYQIAKGHRGRLRIPFWGDQVNHEVKQEGRSITVKTSNEEGAALTVRLTGQSKPTLRWQKITAPRSSPKTKTVLVVDRLSSTVKVAFRPAS